LNAVFLAKGGLINAVDLGELDALLLQLSSSFLVVRSEGLAMTTPANRVRFESFIFAPGR